MLRHFASQVRQHEGGGRSANTARRLDLPTDPMMLVSSKRAETYDSIRTGLFLSAAAVQTAIPIGLGLALATAVGLTLGAVLLKMTDKPVGVVWASVLSMTGVGAAVVLLVTLLSLPPLLWLLRPDGLRTE
ncbi:hypothetical protein AQI88_00195 [Streptomyces cellostaticus]|uniref:Uncharacterized protein n=1 Tax=Streptomyces cellostaticus TaxID=67285 RepID=A0A101NTK7_9ACTN|nr:hypothetical protein AQI88_00195 [Streptomyces cellostaticus]